jgi:16S rRNA C967 or C1407 C5-methylase (RsmB/RsmF family)
MGPPVKITFGRRAVQAKEGLRSKSKPTFSGKILEVVSRTHEENPRAGSSEQTEDCEAENHCNVITDKLKKRGRAHKEQPQFESHQQPHVNAIRFDTVKGTNEEPREKPQKLSMTAQQYKNTQIKLLRGVVQLSPSVKRKGKVRGWEQSKSMSNLYSGLTPTAGQVRSSSKLNLVGPQNTTTPRKE